MQNDQVDYLAHLTGRIIGRREPYEIDIDRILDTAKDNNVALEINSFPDRLDLNDLNCKLAKERGIRCVLGTDAHTVSHLPFIRFGVATARRGWLEKHDVLNTDKLKEIEHTLGVGS
jgi:DNA polymerase (family 10)